MSNLGVEGHIYIRKSMHYRMGLLHADCDIDFLVSCMIEFMHYLMYTIKDSPSLEIITIVKCNMG